MSKSSTGLLPPDNIISNSPLDRPKRGSDPDHAKGVLFSILTMFGTFFYPLTYFGGPLGYTLAATAAFLNFCTIYAKESGYFNRYRRYNSWVDKFFGFSKTENREKAKILITIFLLGFTSMGPVIQLYFLFNQPNSQYVPKVFSKHPWIKYPLLIALILAFSYIFYVNYMKWKYNEVDYKETKKGRFLSWITNGLPAGIGMFGFFCVLMAGAPGSTSIAAGLTLLGILGVGANIACKQKGRKWEKVLFYIGVLMLSVGALLTAYDKASNSKALLESKLYFFLFVFFVAVLASATVCHFYSKSSRDRYSKSFIAAFLIFTTAASISFAKADLPITHSFHSKFLNTSGLLFAFAALAMYGLHHYYRVKLSQGGDELMNELPDYCSPIEVRF